MVEKRYWVEVISWLLSSYPNRGVFTSCEEYLGDPFESEALNARIDLWRALKKCNSAEEIVDFLNMVEEGWFFEDIAKKIELLREAKKIAEERLGRFSKKRRDAGRITSPQDGKH